MLPPHTTTHVWRLQRNASLLARAAPCRAQEVRFLFPVLPLFNAFAAAAVARLYNGRSVMMRSA
jgi:hypothetical protein